MPSVKDDERGNVPGPYGTEEQLHLEVRELTDLLREDSDFAESRDLLAARGLHASEVLLAGLIEGEDNSQYGVFITADLQCVRFEIGSGSRLIRWEKIDATTGGNEAVPGTRALFSARPGGAWLKRS